MMNERITVQSPTLTPDSSGGQAVTWATAYTLWAEVKAVRGSEIERLGRMVSVETYVLKVRYGPTIGTTHRIVWNGKTMNIRSAQDREMERRYLTLECEVGVGS